MRIETINGRELAFDPEEHKYWLAGGEVPSVTTITGMIDKSQPLMNWAVGTVIDYLAERIEDIQAGKIVLKSENAYLLFSEAKAQHHELKKAAADVGTRVHKAVELFLKGEECSLVDIERPFQAFLDWRFSFDQFEPLGTEVMTYADVKCGAGSEVLYAGMADIIVRLNGKVWLIDLKTSNHIYDEYITQLSAYRRALTLNNQFDIECMGILRLDKNTGAIQWKPYDDAEYYKHLKMFDLLCEYWWVSHIWS